jgi:benzil reductase ((S)-benzoin forming)
MHNLYVVTGTTKGLGHALAHALGRESDNIVIEISRGVSGKSGPNTLLHADFADLDSVASAFTALGGLVQGKQFARATLINNAGVVLPVARFDALDAEPLNQNMTVNVVAPILAAGAFARLTRDIAAQRLVVNISSGAAKRAVRGWTAYCAAKAALEMATRVMAEEARESDPSLSVCSLAPGVVDTPMQATIRDVTTEQFPERERFRQMKESGALRDAAAVARDIISLLNTGRLANGGNYDIRELLNA